MEIWELKKKKSSVWHLQEEILFKVQSANRVQCVLTHVVSRISLNLNQLKITASTENK